MTAEIIQLSFKLHDAKLEIEELPKVVTQKEGTIKAATSFKAALEKRVESPESDKSDNRLFLRTSTEIL